MKTRIWWALLSLCLLRANPLTAQTDVLMQHNDLNRTGWNPNEKILNQSNVTPTSFGLLYKESVDDQIYAQPLYVSGVMIDGAPRNVVYVATVSNSVYAFDADDGTRDPYWHWNFTMQGKTVPNAEDIHALLCTWSYDNFKGNGTLGQLGSFGIVGTPVIDKSRNTIYFVSRSKDLSVDNAPHGGTHQDDWDWSSAGFYQQLHALSLITGHDTLNSPVNIDNSITVPGTGAGADAGNLIHFDPRRQNQRSGLVLLNDVVYIPYAAHCDMDYYHGWILGFSAANLSLTNAYVTTPNDGRGGIWMSGAAPAVDESGNFYFSTGNADEGSDGTNPGNVGLSVVKAVPNAGTFKNLSWFKPTTYKDWNKGDLDFGTGVLLIPGVDMLVTAVKSGNIVLLRKNPTVSNEFNENDQTNFLGYINIGDGNESHSSLSYFGGATTQYVYQFSENTNVMAYPVNSVTPGLGSPIINSSVPTNTGFQGGFMSVSSNGTDPSSAILWVTHQTASGGAIHALKADDITQELWNSDAVPADNLGNYAKMTCATIANGRVYVPTFSNSLNVYGLLASNDRCVTNYALNQTATASSDDGSDLPAYAFDGNTNTRWAVGTQPVPGTPQYIYVDLGARYDICKVNILWNQGAGDYTDYGVDFTIDVSDDATTWTTATTVTGNSFSSNPAFNEFNEHVTGRYVRVNVTQGGSAGTSIQEMKVFGNPANSCINPTGLTVSATQNSATLGWNLVPGKSDYIVKYKSNPVQSYITRNVTVTSGSPSLDISGLTCGIGYTFQVQTDCGSGSISNPSSKSFSTLDCSSPCTNAQHFSHGDLGDIQVAGMSCYDGPTSTYTVTGAGNGIGGNGDQFQFEFIPVTIDNDVVARVATQDQIAPTNENLAGVMIRDSVTDISRFMFVGKTGDNSNIVMIYRVSPGGMAVSASIPRPAGADYFRIRKSGDQFSAFYSSNSSGPWTLVGNNQTIGFEGSEWYIGMAVSSLNPTVTSTATFDNFKGDPTALPIQLVSFTATNINDEYTSLKWQTAMEENNDHSDVERSSDGTHFVKILTVKAIGNSDTLHSYTALDAAPEKGINFYRLKQVDLDSRFTYSPVQIAKFGAGIAPLIYPNPVNSLFTAIPGSEPIRDMVIYNIQGRAIKFVMGNSSRIDLRVNISGLASGIYVLKIKTDSKAYRMKIVKE